MKEKGKTADDNIENSLPVFVQLYKPVANLDGAVRGGEASATTSHGHASREIEVLDVPLSTYRAVRKTPPPKIL